MTVNPFIASSVVKANSGGAISAKYDKFPPFSNGFETAKCWSALVYNKCSADFRLTLSVNSQLINFSSARHCGSKAVSQSVERIQ